MIRHRPLHEIRSLPVHCLPVCVLTSLASAAPVATEAVSDGGSTTGNLLRAAGPVGWFLILLSFVGIGLVIDAFIKIRREQLIPPVLEQTVLEMSQRGRFDEVHNTCKLQDNFLARMLTAGLNDRQLGMDAVREGFEQQGVREITDLRQRIAWLGMIAAVAPMLGLLGTVLGMIDSFQILGSSAGAARPDELAVGISRALVTTCIGLVIAVPMTFFHVFFRDRVTRVGQDAAAYGEKFLRVMQVLASRRRATS
ncbi:MAG: MotA/TolQ/ExbB proton channel family protein [Phycisphaerales bacterium]